MTKAQVIPLIIFFITSLSLSKACSHYKEQAEMHSKALEDANRQIDMLNSSIMDAAMRIESAGKRLDDAMTMMLKGEQKAYEEHAERMETISMLERTNQNVHDWLYSSVPDDVCRMLNGTEDIPLPE